MTKFKGYVLQHGTSPVNGSPFVVIMTMGSSNTKTGDMCQLWILHENINPVDAVNLGMDDTVCGDCPHRKQLDGSRSPFDQLAEIVDAVGDKLDVICEGGIHRGTHMLKALSLGAKACSGGRLYLYALAAGGQAGVERAIEKYKAELVRDMKLMGCTKISDLKRSNLRFRK